MWYQLLPTSNSTETEQLTQSRCLTESQVCEVDPMPFKQPTLQLKVSHQGILPQDKYGTENFLVRDGI